MKNKYYLLLIINFICLVGCSDKAPDMVDGVFVGNIDKLVYNIGKPLDKTTTIDTLKRTGFGAKLVNDTKLKDYAVFLAKYNTFSTKDPKLTAPGITQIMIRVFESVEAANYYWKDKANVEFKNNLVRFNNNENIYIDTSAGKFNSSSFHFIEKNIVVEVGVAIGYGDSLEEIKKLAEKYPAWLKERTSKKHINIYNK